MFASATGRNLYLPRVRQLNPCQPLGLKCPTLSQWQEWTLLVRFLQVEEVCYCQSVHCIIYLYQHPHSTPEAVSWSLFCWISKSPKGVYCQLRMPSDPCKWQWKTCGYREMVVYPQEGSESWKLRWSSITWKFNLARPFVGEVSSSASLVSWRGHFQRRSAETFWPYPEPKDILIDIESKYPTKRQTNPSLGERSWDNWRRDSVKADEINSYKEVRSSFEGGFRIVRTKNEAK